MKRISTEASKAAVSALRKRKMRVKSLKLPNGDTVVLTAKKQFVCRVHHCLLQPETKPAKALKRKPTAAKKRK